MRAPIKFVSTSRGASLAFAKLGLGCLAKFVCLTHVIASLIPVLLEMIV